MDIESSRPLHCQRPPFCRKLEEADKRGRYFCTIVGLAVWTVHFTFIRYGTADTSVQASLFVKAE